MPSPNALTANVRVIGYPRWPLTGRTLSHLSPSEREQWLEDFAAHPTRGRILSKAKFENYIRDEARSFADDIDGDSDEDDDADTSMYKQAPIPQCTKAVLH